MSVKEVKTRISELKIGMFVCRLDRPWIETPYFIQGIRIKSVEDIDELAKYCKYVFIDVSKSIQYKANKHKIKNKNKHTERFSSPLSPQYITTDLTK